MPNGGVTATAVTTPADDTVARSGWSDAHVDCAVTSISEPSLRVATALIGKLSPTVRLAKVGSTRTCVGTAGVTSRTAVPKKAPSRAVNKTVAGASADTSPA